MPEKKMVYSNCRILSADSVEHFGLDLKMVGLSQMVADALAD
jgi:hypothetical protein